MYDSGRLADRSGTGADAVQLGTEVVEVTDLLGKLAESRCSGSWLFDTKITRVSLANPSVTLLAVHTNQIPS